MADIGAALVSVMPHALNTLALAYGAPLPPAWETWGICLLVAGWLTGMGLIIYYDVKDGRDADRG